MSYSIFAEKGRPFSMVSSIDDTMMGICQMNGGLCPPAMPMGDRDLLIRGD